MMKTLLFGLLALLSVSAYSADKYSCNVVGEFTNFDNETATVDVENIIVSVDANRSTLFGREQEPEHRWDTRPEVKPWAISISNERDDGESLLVLTLRAPNQNGSVGTAYAEGGSKYIGFGQGLSLDVLCIKK
tara:strand:- start:586 stop:984 length:399 start_codon:yes stop_codon:yes gene_type:complete